MNSTLDVTAKYQSDYPLVVSSIYGTPQGSGWYPQGSNVTFSVESEIDYGNGTRQVFEQWQGDSTSTEHLSWVVLNAPKNVVAVWKTQYEVTIQTVGLPPDASAVVLVGNSLVTVSGTSAYSTWVDANQQLLISVQSTQIQDSNGNYSFQEARVDNQTYAGILDVARPVDVSLLFSDSPKSATSLTLQVMPSVAVFGVPLSITGSIEGRTGDPGSVAISYSSGESGWKQIANVPVSQTGEFVYTWQAAAPGNYTIKAFWPGDSGHSSSSQVVGVRVVSSVPLIAGPDVFTQALQNGMAAAKSVPYLSVFVKFTAALMMLGYVLASFLIPAGPPIVGYLIGSIFVGFIFVFPVSAAVVLVKATRTKRRPSLLWLTPLLVVWLSSLALVLLSPAFVPAQPLLVASQILLVLSNVFAIPMLTAFRLAKLVA